MNILLTIVLALPLAAVNTLPTGKCAGSSIYKLYMHANYSEVIAIADKNNKCWIDYQIVFNSYMALYLTSDSSIAKQKIKVSALAEATKYMKSSEFDGVPDPGPMYVLMGEDKLAETWYRKLLDFEVNNKQRAWVKGAPAQRTFISKIIYASNALKLITNAGWNDLQEHKKLKLLLDAEKKAAENGLDSTKGLSESE